MYSRYKYLDIWPVDIDQSVVCLLIFLTVSLDEQKIFL